MSPRTSTRSLGLMLSLLLLACGQSAPQQPPAPKGPCDGVVCPAGQVCQDGQCVTPACTSDAQCGSDRVCRMGACITAAEACASVHCGSGEVCRAGVCAAVACGPEQACQGLELCLAGHCQLPVRAEAQGLVPAAGAPGGSPGAVGAGVGGTARGATHTLLPGAF